MTSPLRMIALAPLAACSIGAGSAYVGQWRPHEQVDFEACLQDEAGRCTDTKQVKSHVPGRRYWGVIAMLPGSMGISKATYQGESSTLLRVEPSFEYLRGSGRWAIGARAGLVLESKTGEGDLPEAERTPDLMSFPVTAVGRVSLLPRVSAHVGLGYSLYSTRGDEHAFVAGRGLAGVQLALSKTHSESYIILTIEVDRMFIRLDEPYRSTGITGNLGLFF
jgi:hypothetical protein